MQNLVGRHNTQREDAVPFAHLVRLLAGCLFTLPILADVDVGCADFCKVRLEDAENPVFDVDRVAGELELVRWVGAVVARSFFLGANGPVMCECSNSWWNWVIRLFKIA